MAEVIFNAIFNSLNIYIQFRVIDIFLLKKEVKRCLAAAVYTGVWMFNLIVYYLLDNEYCTLGSIIILLFSAAVILYQGSFIRKAVAVFSVTALEIAVEDMVWRFFSYQGTLIHNAAVGNLLSSIILFVIVLLLERFLGSDRIKNISGASYANIVVVLVSNIIIVCLLWELVEEERAEAVFALAVICLMDVSTFYLYDKVNEAYSQRLEKQMMQGRILMYENQLEIISQYQKTTNALCHDMKNHLYLIRSFIADKSYEEASEYMDEILAYMNVPKQYVNTGNRAVDTILNYALGRADDLSCTIKTQITVPEDSFMPEFDLNMLLGNLLDNALEALGRTEERYLYVGINFQKGMLLIRIWNSYDGTVDIRDGTYMTWKSDKENHGIGMRNIAEIVEKYHGEQMIETASGLFKTDIVLYLMGD